MNTFCLQLDWKIFDPFMAAHSFFLYRANLSKLQWHYLLIVLITYISNAILKSLICYFVFIYYVSKLALK